MTTELEHINICDYYSSSDLAMVAAISLFYPLDSIDRTNPVKAQFLFKRDGNLDQLVEAFWRQELKVEPQAYFNQLKVIKSRLYSERKP